MMLPYIILMLLLTGARKREVLDAKWQDFNFEKKIWLFPISKSCKSRHVPMSEGVIQLLATQRYAHLSQDTLLDAANQVPSQVALAG